MYRVADALIEHQRSGNIMYLGWTMDVVCGPDLAGVLAAQAQTMELKLTDWIDEVKQTRKQYYELNYFTTPQLVILRRELGKLKSLRFHASISAVSPMVLNLLQRVSVDISKETIVKVVKEAVLLPSGNNFSSAVSTHDLKSVGLFTAKQENAPEKRLSMKKKSKALAHGSIADKLSSEKMEIMMYIVDRLGYPQELVLKAFEECKVDANKYDIQNWCMENAEKYQFYDENSEDEAESVVDDEPAAVTPQVQPAGISSGIMSWVGHSLRQYFAPPKQHPNAAEKPQQRPPRLVTHSLSTLIDCLSSLVYVNNAIHGSDYDEPDERFVSLSFGDNLRFTDPSRPRGDPLLLSQVESGPNK